jgi:hypothetical protein
MLSFRVSDDECNGDFSPIGWHKGGLRLSGDKRYLTILTRFRGIREKMKKWHVVVLVSLALATILFIPRKFCFSEPSVCGARDARADLVRGRYVLPDYGFPFGLEPETDQRLRQHGLKVRVVGLDIINDSERSY